MSIIMWLCRTQSPKSTFLKVYLRYRGRTSIVNSMRKTKFSDGEYYHVYNRGVDKRNIFNEPRDYQRFLYHLLACNDTQPLLNSQFHYRGSASIVSRKEKEPLVDIICFCLMPNHYHLLLKQRGENGIPLFMQKVGTGCTMYFNTKYDRSGVLFQGAFKSIHIDKEGYLAHLTRYIHLNPADLHEPQWKTVGIRKEKETFAFIYKYPWSSYKDYLENGHLSSILNVKLIKELFLPPKQYELFVKERMASHANLLTGYTFED